MKKIIAYNSQKGRFPWRITIDGKKDPANRDFEDMADVRTWFADMQAAGYYEDYVLKFQR